MKTIIRLGTFETNSSSSHALCIKPKEEFDKWVEGEVIFDTESNNFVPTKKAEQILAQEFIGKADINLDTSEETIKNLIKDAALKRVLRYMEESKENNLNDVEKVLEAQNAAIADMYSDFGFETYEHYFNSCDDSFEESYLPKDTSEVVVFGIFHSM